MTRYLTGVMAAVLAATSLLAAPALADHRPGNVVVMGGTLSLTGYLAAPGRRSYNGRELFADELNAQGGLLGRFDSAARPRFDGRGRAFSEERTTP